MAGSYKHVVKNNGNLASHKTVTDMLENGGDVFEAVEEMYGMIWFLAHQSVAAHVPMEMLGSLGYARESMKDVVETARQNYILGLDLAKETHRKSESENS